MNLVQDAAPAIDAALSSLRGSPEYRGRAVDISVSFAQGAVLVDFAGSMETASRALAEEAFAKAFTEEGWDFHREFDRPTWRATHPVDLTRVS
ncbi:hypothetical protein [Streptomyces sp. NPDC096068]|uniref:hypothetical protein n=1 Tax=Streptomyces sp. NPDC096068 TaxID=3155424 RepID=UPI00331C5158